MNGRLIETVEVKYVAKPDVILRDIHSTYYLVDIKCNYRNDYHQLPVLDNVGKVIWEAITSPLSIEDIVKRVKAAFDVSNVSDTELRSDVSDYLLMLSSLGYVKNVY